MKTATRIVLLAAIAAAIYFGTIGSEQFHRLMEFFSDILQVIGENYLKK